MEKSEMVSMEMEKDQAEKMYGEKTIMADAPKYPYGLKINLDETSMGKLGIEGLPAVGQKMMLHAVVEVCSVSAYDSKEGGLKKGMDLQIVAMELEEKKEEMLESKSEEKKEEMLQDKGALPSAFYAASPEYRG